MRRWRSHSLTVRLTLLFVVLSSSVLLALGILIGKAVEAHFETQDIEILEGKLKLARQVLGKVRNEEELVAALGQIDESLTGYQGLAITVVTASGRILFAAKGADFPQGPASGMPAAGAAQPFLWQSPAGHTYRGLRAQVDTGIPGEAPVAVIVTADIAYHEHFMRAFRLSLWSFVTLAALLTGFLGWVAVRRGLSPLQAIRRQAESVTATRLDARLPVDSVPVELADLAAALNAMLSRLESSFARLSAFSSDLAHEFRTPISNLLTQTQVTLARPRSEAEYRDVLASNIEEYERLSRMVSDMLFLAKADEGEIVLADEAIALGAIAGELAEFYRLLAEEKGVTLEVAGNATVRGDTLMVRRALSNLLSNAVRHTPDRGAILLRVEAMAGGARVCVENSGETIPAVHLPRLFDRFYRADASRHRQSDGAGLGLAITRSIMQAHGGDVSVRSAEGRTEFCLEFRGGARVPPSSRAAGG